MDRQHLVSNSDTEIWLHILSKATNFNNEIDQFLRELPSLFVWVRRWARSWAYSGFGRFVLKSEYDTVLRKFGDLRWVWARCESEAWARSTEYGFITSAPDIYVNLAFFHVMFRSVFESSSLATTFSHTMC